MIRTLPAPLVMSSRWLFWPAWLIVNAAIFWLLIVQAGQAGGDWRIFTEALARPNPYAVGSGPPFVFPPLTAWLFEHAILPLGFGAVAVAHLVSLAPLWRQWTVLALILTSFGMFWLDVLLGNFLIFPVVAGIMAMRGSRAGVIASVALWLLFPRPMFVPLIGWLLWHERWARVPTVVMTLVVGALTLASGQTVDWLIAAVSHSATFPWREWDLGPTRFLGPWWLIVGIPLAVWLTRHGWVGLAGLAISPYAPFGYFVVLFLDVIRWRNLHEPDPVREELHRLS